ncbi:hypothetical protein BRADI_1g42685v3 [Brachypodium distachyon]|uniref:Uncharacterized protein n=1 Tax=Brachypodium distachyon TaxID=15368 RepID=A0A2K2DNZ6_BRADI|nr:hypothetical protein BRADI_1g42685v3 [Brachypodium distachyon]
MRHDRGYDSFHDQPFPGTGIINLGEAESATSQSQHHPRAFFYRLCIITIPIQIPNSSTHLLCCRVGQK